MTYNNAILYAYTSSAPVAVLGPLKCCDLPTCE